MIANLIFIALLGFVVHALKKHCDYKPSPGFISALVFLGVLLAGFLMA